MSGNISKTHLKADQGLIGKPQYIVSDTSAVASLIGTWAMAVDEKGLIHGGFTFSLADYAAMLAVNDPNVVLASANVKFLAPVTVGDKMIAYATIMEKQGRKRKVNVEVKVNDNVMFTGQFLCYITQVHVLSKK